MQSFMFTLSQSHIGRIIRPLLVIIVVVSRRWVSRPALPMPRGRTLYDLLEELWYLRTFSIAESDRPYAPCLVIAGGISAIVRN